MFPLTKKPAAGLAQQLADEAAAECQRTWEAASEARRRQREALDATVEQAKRALTAAVQRLDEARPGFVALEATTRAAEDGLQSALGARRVRSELAEVEVRRLADPRLGEMIGHVTQVMKGTNVETLDRLKELQLTPDADIESVLAAAALKFGRPRTG